MRTMTIEAEESVMPLLKELLEHFKGVSKVSILEDNPYNPEFVKEILEADKSIKDGKGIRMTMDELKELCK